MKGGTTMVQNPALMVVDDELDLCETVRAVLELHGYEVVCFTDGKGALAHLRTGVHPSLILLDIMMPRMNGIQFREELMSDPALRRIPVFVLTGAAQPILDKVAALGLDALRKPIQLNELLEVVERFCRPSRGASL
jgi:two-component system response regulator MprA